ncbi:MAG: hypothetical protein R2845_09160 [Thermomicrobiales bacterium]
MRRGEPCTSSNRASLDVECDLARQRAEIRLVDVSRVGKGPGERRFSAFPLDIVPIETAATIALEPDAVVVIAGDRRNVAFPDQGDRLVRKRAVSDEIAQAPDRFDAFGVDIRQRRFGSGPVSVQIGNDRDAPAAHGYASADAVAGDG